MRSFPSLSRTATAGLIALSLLASALLVPSNLRAQAPAAAAPDLESTMSRLNRAYRMVKAQVSDKAQNAKTLEAVATMQNATITAKGLTPATVAKLPEAERPAKLVQYRKMMVTLLRAEVDLEESLLADDNTKAAAMIPKLDEIQKEGHAAFRAPE